jgi:hypothetical protein
VKAQAMPHTETVLLSSKEIQFVLVDQSNCEDDQRDQVDRSFVEVGGVAKSEVAEFDGRHPEQLE